MKTKLIPILMVLLIVLIVSNADLTCQVEESATCSSGTALLRMKNDTGGYDNAHAELVNYVTPYPNTLCCSSTTGQIGNSSGTAFLNLSAETDAHVQAPNGTDPDYVYPAYISASSEVGCEVYIDGCPEDYTCLVSIASDGDDNTTNAHVSSCGVYDAEACCKILNTPPEKVILKMPDNGNITVFNTAPTFFWYNATDADGNTLTYQLQVDETSSEFQTPVIDVSGITEEGINGDETSYASTEELEVDLNYSWRVRAYDGAAYSEWSDNFTFIISSTVILSLLDEEVNFGSMNPNDVGETTDNDPYPIRIRNDGNVFADINITLPYSSDYLWERYPTPSGYFQYKIDNATSDAGKGYDDESGAFNASLSVIDWENIPESNYSAKIKSLNFSDSLDEAEIDLRIEVPGDEPGGEKDATLLITGWVSL